MLNYSKKLALLVIRACFVIAQQNSLFEQRGVFLGRRKTIGKTSASLANSEA
jgi:hypothetical protein